MPRLKLTNLYLNFQEFPNEEQSLVLAAAKRFGWSENEIVSMKIARRSLDARGKDVPRYCYTLEIELSESARIPAPDKSISLIKDPEKKTPFPIKTRQKISHPPVIVGAGPAGLFAAYRLAQHGLRPLLIERGPQVEERSKKWFQFLKGGAFDPEANLLFGEGGAGAYSDGKLTTRIHDERVKEVLEIFVQCGAAKETLFEAKPHLGSNFLPAIVRRLRKMILELGGTFQFDCKLEVFSKPLTSIQTTKGEIPAEILLLAMGHSARDTYQMLQRLGVAMTAKPFQLGVRVEHPQALINRSQYGMHADNPKLPTAEYALVAKHVVDNLDLYSFCMCPGGEILPASEKSGFLCVNGASKHARNTPFANSGLVVTIFPEQFAHDPMKGIAYQERVEALAFARGGGDFTAPAQKIEDFLKNRQSSYLLATSYPLKMKSVNFHEILPDLVREALMKGIHTLDKKMPGFAGPEGMMLGPEARTCSPIRLDRHPDTREAIDFPGLYPMGEGAGYAGGIMSAAVDGLKSAEAVLDKYSF